MIGMKRSHCDKLGERMSKAEKILFKKELMALAVPLALQNLLQALVGASDALMLGRLTQNSVAAVSIANQITFIMSLCTGVIIGAVGILIAQYWGKEEYNSVNRLLGMAVRYVGIISVVFFSAAFLFPNQLMRIYTPEAELIQIGAEYLKIVSFSYLFSGVAQCILMMMKVSGSAKISVWISAITVLADIGIDFFLIYGIGPVPALGANGSAYSTIAVEAIAMIWCLIWISRRDSVSIRINSIISISRQLEKDLWKIAPGIFASSMSWGLSITLHSFILGHMGTDATAAASVVGVAQQLIQCVTHGLSSGAGIMIGQQLGKNELDKAKSYGQQFWRISAISGIINVGLICLIGPLVYFFYVLEPQAKTYLIQMLIMSAFYMFAYAYNTIITCGVFPAGGDSKYDAISVFFATWCFAIPLSLVGCFVFRWPVIIVYVIMCSDEIVKLPFIKIRYNKFIWLKNLTVSSD